MGILNVTPDSFYDGGRNNTIDKALLLVEKHLNDGASFLDIGGYSSRPGADHIDIETELTRVIPVIEAIEKRFPDCIMSIDTFRGEVAEKSIEAGAAIINDISAFNLDAKMVDVLTKYKVPYVMMHMKGNPQNMQQNTNYENIIKDLILYFSKKISYLNSLGISDIIIDPGFGFSKTSEQNYKLLRDLHNFKLLKSPILGGISRKSMIYKNLNSNILNSINGTTALNMELLENGANILRVHDVEEAAECVHLHQLVNA
jgi:dihydropteroate synthase